MRRRGAATIFGCASVLLSYPEETLGGDLASVAAALSGLQKGRAREGLEATRAWLAGMSPLEAAAIYVDTFDLHRRRTLHLTYFRYGDTRERGMALTALVGVYRTAGVRVVPGELPDFLPALLELAAVSGAGVAVLGEHRAALDALREELDKIGSRYAGAVAAVTATLSGPTRGDRQALARYRAEGPPSERVGLEPFAPPEVLKGGVTTEVSRRVTLGGTRR